VANNDSYTTAFNTQLNVSAPGVLGNDTDANGDPLSAVLPSNVSNGTLSFSTDGSFVYTPNTGYSGPDSFTYFANDGTANSTNPATVSITVLPPVGGDFDGDGVPDTQDNCIELSNADQRDTDNDGYGNRCDADIAIPNDGVVNLSDYSAFRAAFGGTGTLTPAQQNADFNGDGNVNLSDYSIFRSLFGKAPGPSCCPGGSGGNPVARGDTYATPLGKQLTVTASRVSGVLYNDFDTSTTGQNVGNDGLTAVLVSNPTLGTLVGGLNSDGSFVYNPSLGLADNQNDSFTYRTQDADGNLSDVATVNLHILSDQPDYKIMMNYELGMHCTGFEFSYCCVLPPYNSILAQVVKPQAAGTPLNNAYYPRLLEGDPSNGLDGLGRETVLRDYTSNGTFQKYYLEYFHDAQPRREGQGKPQTSTLISDIEGNSMLYHNTPYDSALVDTTGTLTGVVGKLVTGTYNGIPNVVVGDNDYTGAADNYANGWLNHFYIYADLEGSNPANTSLEANKIRLGVNGMVVYPKNVGAALQPMGPNGNVSGFDNVLTFSGDTGTVVYTQMKVLENLPIMLTSPHIWEALGLPLTPFEDSINFFGAPGEVDEDTIRPYVAMKARLHTASCNGAGVCTKGAAVIGSNGQPVIGFGTAPIDIPNCERCHAAQAFQPDGVTPNVNSPSYQRDGDGPIYGPGYTLRAITDLEINYWKSIYPSLVTGSDWYARLKGAAVNMLAMHDADNGTNFLGNYPATTDVLGLLPAKQIPQNTRMGHESVICQKCHGDNVIAAVKAPQEWIPPITEAIHNQHRNASEGGVIVFNDALGRDGGCQGCHPAHRSDGVMDNYPITIAGNNANASGDNRLNQGGCFVGRDVHSNPLKDVDGAETPSHMNAVGDWLVDNVFFGQEGLAGNPEGNRGIWCTNCHTQLSQEIWRHEDCHNLITGECVNDVRGQPTLALVAAAAGLTEQQAIDYLDPKIPGFDRTTDQTHTIWSPTVPDANVATIEVGAGGPVVTFDADGDPSVNILSFCTTVDCVNLINANKSNPGAWRYPSGNSFIDPVNNTAVAVPFNAATDGRDHWLAAGEPHCADCHAAPYVEQSGNMNPFPPFNYPAKASLMRYSRGHQDLGCQACHESIHGLYPVSAAIDTTSYAQAAALNADGSHGPLKCASCHQVHADGIPTFLDTTAGNVFGITDFDSAVGWAHTYTAEASVLNSTCQNCHGVNGPGGVVDPNSTPAQWTNMIDAANCVATVGAGNCDAYLRHAMRGDTSRLMMDKAEIEVLGSVIGTTNPGGTVCRGCHSGANLGGAAGCGGTWRRHLTQGRVSESVWEAVSPASNCGW
jgi:hypothetical protein